MEKEFKITDIWDETPEVKTFRLDGTVDFTPGQFCTVRISGNSEDKPLTFANSPEEDNILFTVKKIGSWTSEMHLLEPGDYLEISEPEGESLNFDSSIDSDIVFIAGGSGITPFMSALRYAADKDLRNDFILINSNRQEKDIIFREELEKLGQRQNMKVVNTLTKQDWDGETGEVDKEMLEKHVSDPKKRLWYICGPPPMIKDVRKILDEMGIEENRQRWEDWQISGKHD